MIKLQPNIKNGIEYIRICELPLSQHKKFYQWLSPSSIFRMEAGEKMMPDCVMYGEYEFWYETQEFDATRRESTFF